MRKAALTATFLFATTLSAFAAKKHEGTMTLKDSQPYNTKNKENKHQAYDLSFQAEGKSYTCRTNPKKSMNATDFVIGTDMRYEIDGDNASIKTPQNKEVKCKIVRVEAIP
jgi:hypothetical protein